MKNKMKFILLGIMMTFVLTLSACGESMYDKPIGAEGGFGWVQWIVTQVAELIFWVSNLAGGYYVVGLIVITLIVRIVGWPIYSKSTALSTNMQMAQPDLEKLREKYMGKTDPQSQRMYQQETMKIYKEYGINPLGCLLPFLQMPIFIAMYQTVRRIPMTDKYLNGMNFRFLWFDFTAENIEPFYSPANFLHNLPFIIFAALVGITMFTYQRYAMKKPDALQNKKFQTAKQQQSEKTMKYMTYFLTFMLVTIAYTSLGIAFYWIVGNLFQFFQTYINRKQTLAKLENRKRLI